MIYFSVAFATSIFLAFPLVALGVTRFAMRRALSVE